VRLYQASLNLRVLKRYHEIFKEPLNVLVSLAYNQADRGGFMVNQRHMIASLIADSGAWSVAKGTVGMSIEAVIYHLKLFGDQYDFYFNFDTDFSDDGFANNIANQIRMEREELRPVPVVHNFFDEEIDYYVKSGKYDRVALGSSQSTNFRDIAYAVDRIKTWGNPDIRVHWFGGSKFEWLCQLPIASCDTSSWAAAGAYGYISFWNEHEPSFNKGHRIHMGGLIRSVHEREERYEWLTYPWRRELEEYVWNTFGLTYEDLMGCDDKFNMQIVNTRFFAQLERRINEERVRRGVPLE
jgi:hypothetical protein